MQKWNTIRVQLPPGTTQVVYSSAFFYPRFDGPWTFAIVQSMSQGYCWKRAKNCLGLFSHFTGHPEGNLHFDRYRFFLIRATVILLTDSLSLLPSFPLKQNVPLPFEDLMTPEWDSIPLDKLWSLLQVSLQDASYFRLKRSLLDRTFRPHGVSSPIFSLRNPIFTARIWGAVALHHSREYIARNVCNGWNCFFTSSC